MQDFDATVRLPTDADFQAAQRLIGRMQRQHNLHCTPLLRSRSLAAACGAREVRLKAECLQVTGSYKVRGALAKVARLDRAQRGAGVIAASAGNHAQGVAFAAANAGIPSVIVMPVNAPKAKILATKNYQRSMQGSRIELHGTSFEDAKNYALALAQVEGLTFIDAFDDPDVIAGQGTLALEIYRDFQAVDVIVVGVGGGGLIAGIADAFQAIKPSVRIIGVEAAGAASMRYALKQGYPRPLPEVIATVADGIKTRIVGIRPFVLVQRHVAREDVVSVDEVAIQQAMTLLLQRCKLQVEGAGAVGLAALLSDTSVDVGAELLAGAHVAEIASRRQGRLLDVEELNVVIVLSGGNVDGDTLARAMLASGSAVR